MTRLPSTSTSTSVRHSVKGGAMHRCSDPHQKLDGWRDQPDRAKYPDIVVATFDKVQHGPRRALTATPAGKARMLYG